MNVFAKIPGLSLEYLSLALLGSVGTEDVLELEGQILEAFRSGIAPSMALRAEI